MSDKPVGLFIATPMFGGQCYGNYTFSVIQLQNLCNTYNIPLEFGFIFNESLVQRGRNELVARFLKSEVATHLVFIDADLAFMPEDVLRLIAADKDIIGGTYPRKRINWDNVKHAYRINPNITNDVLEVFAADYIFKVKDDIESFNIHNPVEVEHIPTGFMCIKREVIEAFIKRYPEIEHTEHNTTSGQPETRYAVFECGINDKREYLSEDFWFCKKAIDIGYKIYLQPDICLGHNGTYNFKGNPPALAAYQAYEIKQVANPNNNK